MYQLKRNVQGSNTLWAKLTSPFNEFSCQARPNDDEDDDDQGCPYAPTLLTMSPWSPWGASFLNAHIYPDMMMTPISLNLFWLKKNIPAICLVPIPVPQFSDWLRSFLNCKILEFPVNPISTCTYKMFLQRICQYISQGIVLGPFASFCACVSHLNINSSHYYKLRRP